MGIEYTSSHLPESTMMPCDERLPLLYETGPLGYRSRDEHGHFTHQLRLDTMGHDRREIIGRCAVE